MKVAWFTPFDPKSAIGDYSEAIVNHLAREDEVTVFSPAGNEAGRPRPSSLRVVSLPPEPSEEVIESLKDFDITVYNLGDHLYFHQPIYEASLRHPGIVILHDLVMRDFFQGYFFLARRNPEGFARHLGRDHGPEAEQEAREIFAGRRTERSDDPGRLRFPMFKSALYGALGVIVHSEYTRGRVAETTGAPVTKIDFPIYGPVHEFVGGVPERRPDADGKVRLLTFGVLNPNKLIHTTIEAFGRSEILRERARFTVIGDGRPEYKDRLEELVRRHGLTGVVNLAGYQSNDELRRQLIDSEVVINLRNPQLGESSAVLLNSLVAGRATVVWNHGFYGEFPDDVVCKISAENQLQPVLEELVRHPEKADAIGRRARDHAIERFETGRFCEAFREFVDDVMMKKPLMTLIDTVSQGLIDLGSGEIDGLTARLAGEMALLWGSDAQESAGQPDSQSRSRLRVA